MIDSIILVKAGYKILLNICFSKDYTHYINTMYINMDISWKSVTINLYQYEKITYVNVDRNLRNTTFGKRS